MTSYIGASPETTIARVRYLYTAVTAQDTFTTATDGQVLSYESTENVDVFVNGVLLVPTTDYAAETGSSIVLVEAADADDKVEVLTYESFQAANYLPTTGGTITGNLGVGTTSPAYQIDIQGSNNNALRLKTSSPILRLEDSDDNAYHTIIGSSDDLYITSDAGNTGNGNMIFRNGGSTERLRIDSSGNVGINQSALGGGAKLEVNGDIGIARTAGGYTFRETLGGGERAGIKSNASNELLFNIAGASEAMRIESNGNLQHLSKPAYFARAWVNFNGTGTVSIRANGNVSSITDYGTGYYGVNFSTAMTDANYAPVAMGKSTTSSYGQSFTTNTHQSHTQTTSQVRIVNSYQDDNSNGVTYVDSAYMFLAVFR